MPVPEELLYGPGWTPTKDEASENLDKWRLPIPNALPEVESDGSISGVENITSGLGEGWSWMYSKDAAVRGGKKIYTDNNGQYYWIADTANVDRSNLEEVPYSDFRRMLPRRAYIGGKPEEVRIKAVQMIPGLTEKVYERAKEYGIDPNLMLHRIMNEGFIDQAVQNYNDLGPAGQKSYFRELWDYPVSGYGEFGLDYAGENLKNGLYSLKDDNAVWEEYEWDDNEGGHPRRGISVSTPNLSSAIEIMAADMAYRQGEVKRRYGIGDKDFGMYTNAAFNMGLYNDKLRDAGYVKRNYSYPDYYAQYGLPYKEGGKILVGKAKLEDLAKRINEAGYYRDGGGIHIKPSHRGRLTELKERTGKSEAELYNDGNPAHKKMVVFARNARKWKHGDGGPLDDGYLSLPYQGEWIPETEQNIVQIPYTDNSPVLSAVVESNPSLVRRTLAEVKARRQQIEQDIEQIQPQVSNLNMSVVPEQQIIVPFETRLGVDRIRGKKDSTIIGDMISEIPEGEELKEFQAMLLKNGYYKNLPTPKITARTKDEIIQLQTMLKEAGYDLGAYGANKDGIDGKLGTKTRAAWKKYVSEHPSEALIESVADGKMGAATRGAAQAYFKDRAKIKDEDDRKRAEMGISLQMSKDITDQMRWANRLTLYPEHAINQVVGKLNEERGNAAADAVEDAEEKLRKARASKNIEAIEEAKAELQVARSGLLKVPGRESLTQAEKRQALAILTYLNGDKPFDYESYLSFIEAAGKQPGDYLGTREKINGKSLYGDDKYSYDFTNRVENELGNIRRYDDEHGYTIDAKGNVVDSNGNPLTRTQQIMRTDSRIYSDPNRGRLGGWSFRVLDNGDIEIYDNFEATDRQAAKGKNDDSAYNEARSSWKRGTTHKLRDVIKKGEYDKIYQAALNNLNLQDNE